MDDHKSVILVLLDLSAAFDTIDHDILLSRLYHRFGIRDRALAWFKSYLTERVQFVKVKNGISASHTLKQGLPQGSVLGPMLYSMYTTPLGDIARKNNVGCHFYADDTQLYVTFQTKCPSDLANSKSILEACIKEIDLWMLNNKLKLNQDKTEVLVISSRYLPRPLFGSILIGSDIISSSSTARNIGVLFDESLSLLPQVTAVCKSASFHLRNIYKIRKYLTSDAAISIIHAFVISRLDYCNALLIGLPKYLIKRLQCIQNSAARLVFLARRFDHTTPLLKELHWLPVEYRIIFKILLITYKVKNGKAPEYLSDLLINYSSIRTLRSSSNNLLFKPRFNLKSFGSKSFAVIAPSLWNDLPLSIRNCTSVDSFKKSLKTFLFNKAFMV